MSLLIGHPWTVLCLMALLYLLHKMGLLQSCPAAVEQEVLPEHAETCSHLPQLFAIMFFEALQTAL